MWQFDCGNINVAMGILMWLCGYGDVNVAM